MTQHTAKVFARVFDYQSTTAMLAGQMSFTVEWKLLTGDRKGGKTKFLIADPIVNDNKLRDDLRDALCAYLNANLAPQTFVPRDIVGYSV
jgi:hypothetical protein